MKVIITVTKVGDIRISIQAQGDYENALLDLLAQQAFDHTEFADVESSEGGHRLVTFVHRKV